MIYLKCPTCSTVLGNRQLEYEEKLKKITDGNTTNEDQKRKLKTGIINSLGLGNPCCKMRIMSCIQLIDIII
jgi:DNA-directed RNA polymerase subunit N (RpoN/RPB10)